MIAAAPADADERPPLPQDLRLGDAMPEWEKCRTHNGAERACLDLENTKKLLHLQLSWGDTYDLLVAERKRSALLGEDRLRLRADLDRLVVQGLDAANTTADLSSRLELCWKERDQMAKGGASAALETVLYFGAGVLAGAAVALGAQYLK